MYGAKEQRQSENEYWNVWNEREIDSHANWMPVFVYVSMRVCVDIWMFIYQSTKSFSNSHNHHRIENDDSNAKSLCIF